MEPSSPLSPKEREIQYHEKKKKKKKKHHSDTNKSVSEFLILPLTFHVALTMFLNLWASVRNA